MLDRAAYVLKDRSGEALRDRDLGLYVHLHCLVTDGAFEEISLGPLRVDGEES